MSTMDLLPVRGLRAALSSSNLLGFNTARWDESGTTGAKAAFVGSPNPNARTTPQNEVVTTLDDDANNTGSLRYFLQNEVNGDSITFAPGLAGGVINLNSTLNITNGITIDGGNSISISGQNKYGVFNVSNTSSGAPAATIENLTIEHGNSTGKSGPAGYGFPGKAAAGGVYLDGGPLVLSNNVFLSNTATGGSGSNAGQSNPQSTDKAAGNGGDAAGAVYVNSGTITASNLTFINNTATAGKGGAADQANSTPGTDGTAYPISNSAVVRNAAVTCYVTGTLVRTVRGEVAVEALRVGDLAVTASGHLRPIVWIGHRDIDGYGQALPRDQQPVCIRANAFGPGLPARTLRLSPGHPVLVGTDADGEGGVLVPIMCLINGTTIAREPATSVTYWHVELDAHDILLAEGLAAESYLDWGDRPFFAEGSDHALHNPDFVVPGLSGRCRPVAVEGAVIEAERVRLDAVFAAELTGHSAWGEADNSWLAA